MADLWEIVEDDNDREHVVKKTDGFGEKTGERKNMAQPFEKNLNEDGTFHN